MDKRRVIEAYYPAKQVAALLSFQPKWVIQRVRAGDFGPGCFYCDGDYRLPASGVNAFIARHAVPPPDDAVVARTPGECRRKLKKAVQTSGRSDA